jgi:membrane protein YdbS with pleckstrin-like domain
MQPLSTSTDRPHAPPMDEEAIYYEGSPLLGGRPEKVFLIGTIGVFFLVAPILLKMIIKNHEWPSAAVSLSLVAIGFIFWIYVFVIVKSIRYRISNYRIDYERGIISKDINTLELWHVEDIAFHQSVFGRILGIGTISVVSHDENMPDLEMRGLPDARKLFDELKQRIIAVKRQTGVLKLDTGG